MKNIIRLFSAVTFFCFPPFNVSAQLPDQHVHHGAAAQVLQAVPSSFDPDSLQGFDEAAARQHAYMGSVLGMDLDHFMNYARRNYINRKYNLNQPQARPAGPGGGNTPQAPCTNVDFETGNTSGWTVSGDVITTNGAGNDPYGNFPVVCPGGNFSLKLGNATNPATSIAKQTFAVTPANSYYLLKMAMVILNFPHTTPDAAKVYIRFRDQANNIVACPYFECYYASNVIGGAGQSYGLTGFQTGSNGVNIGNQSYPTTFIPWTNVGFDLTPYIGQNITIEIENDWCVYDYDWAYTYIDGQCSQLTTSVVSGCSGAVGTLSGPTGMTSYTWTGPPTSTVSTVHTQTVSSTVSGIYTVQCTPYSSCGTAVYTYTMSMVSGNNPIADFNYTTTPCQSTYSVPYTDNTNLNSGPAITNYYWDFDNNGTVDNTTANPTYAFPGPGTYTTKLKVSNGGCLDSINKTITIVSGPTANFNLTNNCLNAVSNFTSTSTPTAAIVSQVWNWGDGTPNGSGTSPGHTFLAAGTHTVKLVVTNSSLCKDSISKAITIYPNPVISFTAANVCMGTAVSFTNTSGIATGTLAYAWDFDNNGTTDNTTQSPANAYAAPGTYTVELKATSANNCRDSSAITVKVNTLPTATFTPVNACIGNAIVLNNTSSVPNPDNISQYNWSFGTGASSVTSTNQNPAGLSYTSSGVKTITLDITANTTCTASITKTVTVHPSPAASFSATAVCQATQTAFTDLSTTGTGTISGWSWDFTNDGTPDNLTQNPGFTYPASGNYTAALQVTSSNGCVNTFTLPVDVWGHTVPDFSPDNVCYGTATTFTNLTGTTVNANTGGAPSYVWAFADGSPNNNSISPVHTYTLGANGNATYNVTLTATSSHNCVDNVVKPVNVYALPTAAFTSNTVCLGSPSQMTDASSGNGNALNNYQWDFLSNGTIDATGTSNPNYTFPAFGFNAVSYTVSTTPVAGLTCSGSTTTLTVYVDLNPVPDFTFVNNCINAQPNTFDGSGSTIAVGTNTSYAWAYGDGNSGSGQSTSHTYNNAGTYSATLTVTSDKGCVKTVVKQTQVYQKPIMNISSSSACEGAAMSFTATEQPGSGTVTDWYWDYNNNIGTIEATGQQIVSYVYPAAGNQSIGLVTVSSPGQCRDTIRRAVYVNHNPVAAFSADDPDGCSTHCVTFTDASTVTGPARIVNWAWSLGDGGSTVNSPNNASRSHCYDNTTGNQLKYYDVKLVVTTDSGCTNTKDNKAMITVYPLPTASYEINPDPGNVVEPLEYFSNYSVNYSKWYWSFGDGPYKSDSVNVSPTHFYSSETAQTYYTNLIVLNQYGCSDTAYVSIEIGPEFAFYIPNAFTPANSDNVNDLFSGKGIGIEKYDMWIFDRWGEMIYYTDDIAKGWDGRKTGKSSEVQQDVYVWKVKIKDVLGKDHSYVGHVTLLR